MSKPLVYITGAGGGKSGSGASTRTPVETPDSLRSQATARILDLLCEGEIEGLVNGLQSVFLDETPLQNLDGSFNFSGVTVHLNTGTQQQSYIPGFSDSEAETAVGTEVKAATPIVRQLTDANLNAVRVTVSVAALYSQNTSNGDMNGASVALAVDIQPAGGAWQTVRTDTITGKTMSRYQRSYRVPLTGSAPWQVRVRRLTPDTTTATVQDKLAWDSYTEIIEAKLRYPNSAVVGLEAPSTQFSTVPARAYDVKLQRLQVPSNYDPNTRTYNGDWDGTFKTAWSDNPAWGFYLVASNDRFGLGSRIPAALMDKWTLYQIGRYCDELVPDGFGGMEPRFSMNVYLQTRADAYKVLNNLASVFRGMAYYAGGMISAAQDAPSDPVSLYCPANVVDGRFVYQGSSIRARHTVALVAWNDPTDFCRQKVEYVEDPEGIRRYGINPTQITAIGCTSRGQARRAGKWLLYTERVENETVTFRAGLDGTYLRPGNVVMLIDPDRDGKRLSGRIHAAGVNQVTLDEPVEIEDGKSYDLYCMLPSGILEHRRVANEAGETSVLDLTLSFSDAPQVAAIWALVPSDLEPALYRILAVNEPEPGQLEITALVHYPGKYAEIEQGVKFDLPGDSNVPTAGLVEPPQNLAVTEELYPAVMGAAGVRLLITWDRSPNRYVASYTCEIRRELENWITLSPDGQTAVYESATQGKYQVRVTAISVLGVKSAPAEIIYTVIAMTAPPANVTGLQIYGQGNGSEYDGRECRLTWHKVSTADAGYGTADGLAGQQPPEGWFRDYVLRVYGEDGSLRRTEFPTIETWNYSYERNYLDGNGTPARNFSVALTARDRWFRESAKAARISVSNPPPRALTAREITINAFAGAFTVDLTPVSIPDIAGYLIYASQTFGFAPDESTLISRGGTHVYKKAAPGSWYIRVAAYDTFGQDALVYSGEYSCVVPDALVLPDQLYTTLRTDFWIRDSIFFFTAQTLEWSDGSIFRGTQNYILSAGSLPLADDKYIIATLGGGVATIRVEPFENGIPTTLLDNEIIIAVTSAQPNSAGNYICYVRQANSIQLEGAIIRDATITDAKITGTISATRITTLDNAVEINGLGITLADIHDAAATAATAAQNAQDAADQAAATASNASAAASEANALLFNIASDSKLTPNEKSAAQREWNSIVAEKTAIDAQADTFSVSRSAYDAYYTTLASYITPLLADPTSTSDIVGTDFRGKFTDYYLGRTNLLNSIAAKARSLAIAAASTADWTGVSSIPLRFADPAPGGSGLFIGSSYMGYYASGAWKSYLRDDGSFYFAGKDANSYIRWDGGAADLVVRGKLNADDIQSGGTITGCKLQTAIPGTGTLSFVADASTGDARLYDTDGTELVKLSRYNPTTWDGLSYSTDVILNNVIGHFGHNAFAGMVLVENNASDSYTAALKILAHGESGAGAIVASSMGPGYAGGTGAINAYGVWNAGIFAQSLHSFAIAGEAAHNHAVIGASEQAGYSCFKAMPLYGAGTYASFTGNHDCLIEKDFAYMMGDIVVDAEMIAVYSVSDAISRVELSTSPRQPSVIGVIIGSNELTEFDVKNVPALKGYSDVAGLMERCYIAQVNALGEGAINVCSEGGDIVPGDLICSSSIPGKGMRQEDGVIRNYTVAKAREACTWPAGDTSIKRIACVYHCG